ncbi:CaiB/BaiF CoA transferase family protein [Xanthobacteraceae bacterium A53D]
MGPLAGTRILDLTTVMMGPSATQMLGDMGADVIKVEPPQGDPVRLIGPGRSPGMGGLFLNANGSKRSVVLDLKSARGHDAFLRMLEQADVIAYNIRPQAMARLGLSYEDVRKVRPDIIYAGMFGYGQNGPYAARPAYDDLIQGASLIPWLIAQVSEGGPRYVPSAIADRIVGMAAVGAICAALFHKAKSGEGQRVDVPMFETLVSIIAADHLGGLTFEPPMDAGGYPRLLTKHRRPYQTSDGYICALLYNDKQWRSFYAATGRADQFDADPRLHNMSTRNSHIDQLYGEVAALFLHRTTAEWIEILEKADIPFAPFHDLYSILEDPHLQAVGFFAPEHHPSEGPILRMQPPSRWSLTQPETARPAPRLGEHTRAVLAEAGLAAPEIDALIAQGAAMGEAA